MKIAPSSPFKGEAHPPAFATALVPSFEERRYYRGGRPLAAELRKLGAWNKLLSPYLTDDRIAAHIAVCDALAATGGRVIVTFGKRRAEYELREHRGGLILFARLDLILCPVPRDFRGDSYMPGAEHRISYARWAVRERARKTGSEAAEWFPTGELYQLRPEK